MRPVAVGLLLSLTIAGTAHAATGRFAAPGGGGAACAPDAPCSIQTAFSSATAGDDITLAPGTYDALGVPFSSALSMSANAVTVHGTIGQPAVIRSSASYGVQVTGLDDVISDVVVHDVGSNGSGFYFAQNVRAERVMGIAESTAGGNGCVVEDDAEIDDSVCLGVTQFATGLSVSGTLDGPDHVTARNVTAVSRNAGAPPNDNQGNAISVQGVSGRPATLTLINSIAIGDGHDVRVLGVSDGFGTVMLDHTDAADISLTSFTTVYTPYPVLAAPPTFASLTDLHQATGSSSIDAGAGSTHSGAYDLDGVPRVLGAAIDRGAYEQRVAAAAATAAASDVSATSATLHAHVDPRGSAATYHFEYGPTTAYGARTPERALAQGTPALDVSEGVSGLPAGGAVHARIVVTGPGGGATGADVAFTTAAPTIVTLTKKVPTAKPCTVPSVKSGSTVLATITKLAKAGCKLGSTSRAKSKKIKKGRLIRLSVKAHSKTTKSVGIVVSRGRT